MRISIVILTFCVVGSIGAALPSELVSVNGVVLVVRHTKGAADNGEVAIWLKPVTEPGQSRSEIPMPRGRLRIVQQNKRFEPSFLVVPVGSVVDFPNLDPFFHNVFLDVRRQAIRSGPV